MAVLITFLLVSVFYAVWSFVFASITLTKIARMDIELKTLRSQLRNYERGER